VLGEGNGIANLPTIMNLKGNQDQFGFAGTHEYTLVYTNYAAKVEFQSFPVGKEVVQEEWLQDEIGLYKKGAPLVATGADAPRSNRPYMFYPILLDRNNAISSITKEEFVKIYDKASCTFDDAYVEGLRIKYEQQGYQFILPRTSNTSDGFARWRWGFSQENIEKLSSDVIVNNARNSVTFYKKQRPELGELPVVKPKTIWYKPEYSSGNGTSELKNSVGRDVESALNLHPKPIELIKDILIIGAKKNALILDFFAGSGTTLHATMALNAEDGGKRQCILVTNNENDICEKVTYERNKRVIQGYTNAKGQAIEGLVNNNLRYYKTDFVPREPSLKNRRALVGKATGLVAIKENAYAERPDLSGPGYTVIAAKDSFVLIVSDPDAVPDVVDCIRELNKPCKVYVFSPGNYAWDEDFAEVRSQVELIPMPEAYYAALENELPKRRLVAEAAL